MNVRASVVSVGMGASYAGACPVRGGIGLICSLGGAIYGLWGCDASQ